MRLTIFIIVALPITASARDIHQQAFSWALNNCNGISVVLNQDDQLEAAIRRVVAETTDGPLQFFYQTSRSNLSVHGHGLSYDELSALDLPDKTRFVAKHMAWHLARPEHMRDCLI